MSSHYVNAVWMVTALWQFPRNNDNKSTSPVLTNVDTYKLWPLAIISEMRSIEYSITYSAVSKLLSLEDCHNGILWPASQCAMTSVTLTFKSITSIFATEKLQRLFIVPTQLVDCTIYNAWEKSASHVLTNFDPDEFRTLASLSSLRGGKQKKSIRSFYLWKALIILAVTEN